jgi:protease YdgD
LRARLAAALALLLAAPAVVRGADRRIPVDPKKPLWNAVAKVQSNIGEHCSGVLIAPAVVLTAAHCLYNPRTRAILQPVSLHVLFGYERDQYRFHRRVRRFALGAGFDGRKGGPQPGDWARLELAAPVPIAPLPLLGHAPAAGTAAALAGYNQDKAQLLLADLGCHVLRVMPLPAGGAFVVHDCEGTYGTSGGPLLVRQGAGWAVAAIAIAASRSENLALAPPLPGK